MSATIKLHKNDLPDGLTFTGSVAIDTETLGLKPHRDRLCLVQLSGGDDNAHLVQLDGKDWSAPRLKALLADPAVLKIFHFGRFDIAMMAQHLGVLAEPVYCTKIASKLARTYTDRHGLKDLCSGAARRRPVQAAAELRLGRRQAHRPAEALCRQRRALPARAESQARRDARARGAHGGAQACFRFLPCAPSSTLPASRTRTSSRIDGQGPVEPEASRSTAVAVSLPDRFELPAHSQIADPIAVLYSPGCKSASKGG